MLELLRPFAWWLLRLFQGPLYRVHRVKDVPEVFEQERLHRRLSRL